MDSRLAADPVVRNILDILTTLENAAGVRAHYRVLESPPLGSIDPSSINTVARVLSDWIGLRNAIFNINIVDADQPARIIRTDPDQEEFAMELPVSALSSPDCALGAVARQVARAYLITSNIGGGSVDPDKTAGSMADVTATFLGMGKILLNAPAAGTAPVAKPPTGAAPNRPAAPELQSLSEAYLAFTHRLVCSMRGLDWSQHTTGLSQQAIRALREWDSYRDTVFSQALRNVLTASASHRPLMDAIEDNHLALARFDQLKRILESSVVRPLDAEIEAYHQTCREGMERLGTREQDTYDPCLLYLNQLRRRMDLQRYADMLLAQQDQVLRDLRVLTAALSDLNARQLVHTEAAGPLMHTTHCPFDGTPISIHDENQDSRVRCAKCGYTFLATSGIPQISAIKSPAGEGPSRAQLSDTNQPPDRNTRPEKVKRPQGQEQRKEKPAKNRSSKAAMLLIWGILLMPVAWLPMLGYVLIQLLNGQDTPLLALLGKVGIGGSIVAGILLAAGMIAALTSWTKRRKGKAAPAAPEQPTVATKKTSSLSTEDSPTVIAGAAGTD